MITYAANTSVSVQDSRAEIETVLSRYGADQFVVGVEPGRAMIGFRIEGSEGWPISVRMVLPLPAKGDKRFTHRKVYSRVVENPPEMVHKLWEQACRSLWRSLALVVKAKLEAVSAKISTIEREFMADIMLPGGQTLGQHTLPQLKEVYEKKGAPRLLLTGATA